MKSSVNRREGDGGSGRNWLGAARKRSRRGVGSGFLEDTRRGFVSGIGDGLRSNETTLHGEDGADDSVRSDCSEPEDWKESRDEVDDDAAGCCWRL